MEKHRCKLCFRKFANGRALGGHMRSHMMNLPIPPKANKAATGDINNNHLPISCCETQSSSSTAASEEEIPSIQAASGVDHHHHHRDSSSPVSLQDRESENESFKRKNTTTTTKRRRSKRVITSQYKPSSSSTCSDSKQGKQHYRYRHFAAVDDGDDEMKKMINDDDDNVNDMVEPMISCTSEVTSDEDLAFCLMMMSRDSWSSNKLVKHATNDQEVDDDDNEFDDGNNNNTTMGGNSSTRMMMTSKKRYKCDTCSKVFRSYQALGGHRASHKKNDNRVVFTNENYDSTEVVLHQNCNFPTKVLDEKAATTMEVHEANNNNNVNGDFILLSPQKKVHECPVCLRVFASGQALGGHKRSHVMANNSTNINGFLNKPSPPTKKKKNMMVISSSNYHTNDSLIDLNLPAPLEDDEEISDDQVAVSAVSDVVHS